MRLTGERIYRARLAAGLTQADLAIRLRALSGGSLKTTSSIVSGWENNANLPSAEALGYIAQACGVQVDDLYERGNDDGESADGEEPSVRARRRAHSMVDELFDLVHGEVGRSRGETRSAAMASSDRDRGTFQVGAAAATSTPRGGMR